MRLPLLVLVLLSLSASAVVSAHSWIECLDTDRSVVFDRAAAFIYGGQGAAGLCQGYQRNYRGRGTHVHDEELMVKILKDDYVKPNVRVCKPGSRSDTTTGFHKRLRVTPGTTVYFAYMPNGHVAVDKAARGTHWGLYWSARPSVELVFTTHLTPDKLMDGTTPRDFDDGVCGQTFSNRATGERSGRAGDAFPCVGDFTVPTATAPGVYQVVWMWKFWDEQNDQREIETVGGKYGGAAYSSCFDVEVMPSWNATTDGTSGNYVPGTVVPAAVDTVERNESATTTPITAAAPWNRTP